MTNKEFQIIKKEILHYLCDDFHNNQAIFDRKEGWQVFGGTDLTMVMDKVVNGLKAAQAKIKTQSEGKENDNT